MISIFLGFQNMRKMQFFFNENILGNFLEFVHMQQKFFFLFENVLKFFLKKIQRKPGILISDLYFKV
jgi:hypothetical protein